MLGIEKRLKKLGEDLSAKLTERARFYIAQGKEANNPNLNVVGVILAEVANALSAVTSNADDASPAEDGG